MTTVLLEASASGKAGGSGEIVKVKEEMNVDNSQNRHMLILRNTVLNSVIGNDLS